MRSYRNGNSKNHSTPKTSQTAATRTKTCEAAFAWDEMFAFYSIIERCS